MPAEIGFECGDITQPVLPEFSVPHGVGQMLPIQQFRVHAAHQHFFIVTTVMDADAPPGGDPAMGPPQEIMPELFRSRLLETGHLHALRVDPRHHMTDRAILASSVHCLKDRQHSPAILRIEPCLQRGQPRHAVGQ